LTAEEYDREEVMKAVKQTLLGLTITVGLVYKFELIQPLFIQSFMMWKTVLFSSLVQIHIFGKKAEGELKRPFKVDSPFGSVISFFVLSRGSCFSPLPSCLITQCHV